VVPHGLWARQAGSGGCRRGRLGERSGRAAVLVDEPAEDIDAFDRPTTAPDSSPVTATDAGVGTSPAMSTTAGTRIIGCHPSRVAPCFGALRHKHVGPAARAASAPSTSPTVCSHKMSRSCARAIRSAGTPMWNEIAAGPNFGVAWRGPSLKGRPVWLIANGRSGSRAHCSRSSPVVRTAVPTLPNATASQTAPASRTSSHGPNGASTIGTSIPSRSQNPVCSPVPPRFDGFYHYRYPQTSASCDGIPSPTSAPGGRSRATHRQAERLCMPREGGDARPESAAPRVRCSRRHVDVIRPQVNVGCQSGRHGRDRHRRADTRCGDRGDHAGGRHPP